MKSLRFQRLYLCSTLERAAQKVTFDPKVTVVLGENDTGKSSLIKSIYSAFGAEPYKTHPSWLKAKADVVVDFTVDDIPYRILRSGSQFALFNSLGELLWRQTGITSGVGPEIAKLLDFKLMLQNRSGDLVIPPPAYCFLPYYIDQDIGWLKSWSSFAGLAQFENAKQDATYFHAGLRPNEYYVAKAAKLTADKMKEDLRIDRRAVDRAAQRLQANRRSLKFDLQPAAFGERLDALLSRCQTLQFEQEKIQHILTELHSKRAMLLEQIHVAGNALTELDADYEFLRKTTDAEVVCPTCGTVHDNDFANKYGLIGDADLCRGFLLEAKDDFSALEVQIGEQRQKLDGFAAQIKEIEDLLDEQRGEVKLRDLIEGESYRLMDDAIDQERATLDLAIGRQDVLADAAVATMKSFDDRKHQKRIKDFYLQKMTKFVAELHVPGLAEENYKRIDCSISETGSDLPRALLAYYFAFLHTAREFSANFSCPTIVDSPLQQDPDDVNAARIIDFTIKHRVPDAQLILGTVSLRGVDYNGHIIETSDKYHLLTTRKYDEVREIMAPLFQQLLI